MLCEGKQIIKTMQVKKKKLCTERKPNSLERIIQQAVLLEHQRCVKTDKKWVKGGRGQEAEAH